MHKIYDKYHKKCNTFLFYTPFYLLKKQNKKSLEDKRPHEQESATLTLTPHKPLSVEETHVDEYESTFDQKPEVLSKQAQVSIDALRATVQIQQLIGETHEDLNVKIPKQDTGIVKQDNIEAVIVTEDISHDKENIFKKDRSKEQIAIKNIDAIILPQKSEIIIEETFGVFEDEKLVFDQSKITDVTKEQRVAMQQETNFSESTVPVKNEKHDSQIAKMLMSDMNFAPQIKETETNEFLSILDGKAPDSEKKAKTLQDTHESIQIKETLTDEQASYLIVPRTDQKSGTITINDALKTPTQMSTQMVDALDILQDVKPVEELGQLTQDTKQAIIVSETIIGAKEADLFVETIPAKDHTAESQVMHLIAPEQNQIITQDTHGEFLDEMPQTEQTKQVQSDTKHKQTGQVMEHVLGESVADEVLLEFKTQKAKPDIGALHAATVSETVTDTGLVKLKSNDGKDVQAMIVQSSVESLQVHENILHEREETFTQDTPKEQQASHIFNTLKSSEVIETIPVDSTTDTKLPDTKVPKESVKQSHVPHEAFSVQETTSQENEVFENKPKTREYQANISFTEAIAAEQKETFSHTAAEELSTTVPINIQANARTTIQEKHAPITTQVVPDDKHESFTPDELPIKSQSAISSISDVASSVPIITETLLTEELGTHKDILSHVIETVTETVVDTAPRHTVKQNSVEISEVEEETVIKPKKAGKRER